MNEDTKLKDMILQFAVKNSEKIDMSCYHLNLINFSLQIVIYFLKRLRDIYEKDVIKSDFDIDLIIHLIEGSKDKYNPDVNVLVLERFVDFVRKNFSTEYEKFSEEVVTLIVNNIADDIGRVGMYCLIRKITNYSLTDVSHLAGKLSGGKYGKV